MTLNEHLDLVCCLCDLEYSAIEDQIRELKAQRRKLVKAVEQRKFHDLAFLPADTRGVMADLDPGEDFAAEVMDRMLTRCGGED